MPEALGMALGEDTPPALLKLEFASLAVRGADSGRLPPFWPPGFNGENRWVNICCLSENQRSGSRDSMATAGLPALSRPILPRPI